MASNHHETILYLQILTGILVEIWRAFDRNGGAEKDQAEPVRQRLHLDMQSLSREYAEKGHLGTWAPNSQF